MRIAVVRASEDGLAAFLAALAATDLPVRLFSDAASFQRIARRETFDCLLLEWARPAAARLALIEDLRSGPLARVPIILLAGPEDLEAAADGLYAGADDVLALPVAADLLKAKLVAAWRRSAVVQPDEAVWRAGPYEIDWRAGRVVRCGRRVGLTRKEFALLETLLAGAGRPLSRSYLLEAVWGTGRDHDTRTLDAHVYRLRNKLALREGSALRLTPIYGYGYQLDVARAD